MWQEECHLLYDTISFRCRVVSGDVRMVKLGQCVAPAQCPHQRPLGILLVALDCEIFCPLCTSSFGQLQLQFGIIGRHAILEVQLGQVIPVGPLVCDLLSAGRSLGITMLPFLPTTL